jgi:hypothetical protein
MHAGNEFARIEGFRQVVVGAHFETDDAVDFVTLGGKHHDGDGVFRRAQAAADG